MSSRKVIVVGAGNAGLCAAISAHDQGASVVVLECAPENERGGNSRFTAGAIRVAYDGVEELKALMPDLSSQEIEKTDFGTYTQGQFFDDMARVTEYRSDPDLVDLLVKRSMETLLWMRDKGVRFVPIYGRQAFEVDGRFKFWGGLTVEAWGGGPGLVDALFLTAERAGEWSKERVEHQRGSSPAVSSQLSRCLVEIPPAQKKTGTCRCGRCRLLKSSACEWTSS